MTQQQFVTTHWSVVLEAADSSSPASAQSLNLLCEAYWYPLYVFVRGQGYEPSEAEDLTQAFFARLMEKQSLASVGPEKGRFRSFLLVCMRRFLVNEWEKASAIKRGGGRRPLRLDLEDAESRYATEPSHTLTPERIYARRWALTVLERACDSLAEEFKAAGKTQIFETLKVYLSASGSAPPYTEASARLGMSLAAVKVTVHRLRERYRGAIRAEIRGTVDSEEEIEDEIRDLFKSLSE